MTRGVAALLMSVALGFSISAEAAKGSVGAYTASAGALSARSYWLEGDGGVILIGTQLLASEANNMLRDAQSRTGKKAVIGFVLAPTPEQFNGTGTLQKHGIKVYTSEQVLQHIPAAAAQARKRLAAQFGTDYPGVEPKPVSFGNATQKMMIAGLPLTLYVVEMGAAQARVAVESGGQLFCGDLVAGAVHPALADADLEQWLLRLRQLRLIHPQRVYPSHGQPGGRALIANQMIYLRQLMGFIAAERPRMPVDLQALARVKQKMLEVYPSFAQSENLEPLIRSEWERQARN